MKESIFTLEGLSNPPQKVQQMCEAVIALMLENVDLNAIKVVDITTKANIGKGTAYEYFKSKEEIIAFALFYDYRNRIEQLAIMVNGLDNFKKKIAAIMDWSYENRYYHKSFTRVIQMSLNTTDICSGVEAFFPEELQEQMHGYLLQEGDAVMEEGCKEGLYNETDLVKRRLAFTNMVATILCVISSEGKAEKEKGFFPMSYESAKQYAYENLIKVLTI